MDFSDRGQVKLLLLLLHPACIIQNLTSLVRDKERLVHSLKICFSLLLMP
jgi:hypothetical protein